MSTNSARNTESSKLDSFYKKARIFRAFLFPLALVLAPATFAASPDACNSTEFNETVEIKAVIDGDTLLLKNGHSLRLIGINTPELQHEKPAEPMAHEAKTALENIIKDQPRLGIIHDHSTRDRYQRLLAHVFLPNGTNIQATLLEQGMGAHVFFPPNNGFFDCYRNAEDKARENGNGIWSLPRYQPHPADELTARHLGFYIVSGRVRDIRKRHGTVWLDVNDRFSFRIDEENLKYFKKLKPEVLRTHRIEASGWIFPYNSGLSMRIRHPDSIKILD